MPQNHGEIEQLRALVRKNQEAVENLREMVEHLAGLLAALEAKDRQRAAEATRPRKKLSKQK